ncbi:MAG TPA: methionyl-tRNA formyltransferase [Candidatus Hydrogenedentes bacterium]|nr:methionyl-tRNA formyltransferase [Candidatus Hydrogenedentota bacterium]
MRTVFCGTPELAVPTLAAVAERHEVAAVVCPPDKPQGRKGTPVPPPVKTWALAHGLPVHQPEKLNDGAFEAWLRELAPEVGVVAAYGRFLKQPILDLPPHGWLNMHPSLLPRWRGSSPIRSAVIHGDAETGASIMRITMEMDAGDVLLQEATPIGPDETALELADRLAVLGAHLMTRALDLVARGEARFTPQDAARATYSKLLERSDGYIRWNRPAREIHNLVRGSLPWPTVQCGFRGQVCKVLRAAIVETPAGADPGVVVEATRDTVHVATADLRLAILEFQAPGKRAMRMDEFLRGHRIDAGDRFEDLA